MSNRPLIAPGDPLETVRRILHKIASDIPALTRQKLLRDQAPPEEWERAEKQLTKVDSIRKALEREEEE